MLLIIFFSRTPCTPSPTTGFRPPWPPSGRPPPPPQTRSSSSSSNTSSFPADTAPTAQASTGPIQPWARYVKSRQFNVFFYCILAVKWPISWPLPSSRGFTACIPPLRPQRPLRNTLSSRPGAECSPTTTATMTTRDTKRKKLGLSFCS